MVHCALDSSGRFAKCKKKKQMNLFHETSHRGVADSPEKGGPWTLESEGERVVQFPR